MPVLIGCLLVGVVVGLVLPAAASRKPSRKPALTVRVTDNRTYVGPHSEITYRVTVLNEGEDRVSAIDTRLRLASGLSFLAASHGGTGRGTSGAWSKFSLGAGEQRTFTLRASVPDKPEAGTRYESTATATAPGAIADATDETFVGAAQLAVRITDNAQEAGRGDTLSYTVIAANSGTLPLQDVRLTSTLAAGLSFVSADHAGSWTAGDRRVAWAPFALAAGEERRFNIVATVPAGARSGQVLRTSGEATAQGLSHSALDETLVTVATGLALSKTDGRADAQPGEELTYTITVRNTGEVDLDDISLLDRFGDRLKFVSVSGGGSHHAGQVSWPKFGLQSGEIRDFSVVARVLEQGENNVITNEVIATTPSGRRSRAEDRTLVVRPARIQIRPTREHVPDKPEKPCRPHIPRRPGADTSRSHGESGWANGPEDTGNPGRSHGGSGWANGPEDTGNPGRSHGGSGWANGPEDTGNPGRSHGGSGWANGPEDTGNPGRSHGGSGCCGGPDGTPGRSHGGSGCCAAPDGTPGGSHGKSGCCGVPDDTGNPGRSHGGSGCCGGPGDTGEPGRGHGGGGCSPRHPFGPDRPYQPGHPGYPGGPYGRGGFGPGGPGVPGVPDLPDVPDVPDVPDGGGPGLPQLPFTGPSVLPVIGIAALLLGIGGTVLFVNRRRRFRA
ncbi:DUF11 domain-containing protein [Acrocarpospora catenulata]|uniref:DUF11 domain-containing protein n=1 Tax=Acrocarpospora catenulata TaxID=2836182 RepID=UPI001BDA9AA4|nr:DUF11 domain-containing protein [Acrocarpospora catenulata]